MCSFRFVSHYVVKTGDREEARMLIFCASFFWNADYIVRLMRIPLKLRILVLCITRILIVNILMLLRKTLVTILDLCRLRRGNFFEKKRLTCLLPRNQWLLPRDSMRKWVSNMCFGGLIYHFCFRNPVSIAWKARIADNLMCFLSWEIVPKNVVHTRNPSSTSNWLTRINKCR